MKKNPFKPRMSLGLAQECAVSEVGALSRKDDSGEAETYEGLVQELPLLGTYRFPMSVPCSGGITVLELAEMAKNPFDCSKPDVSSVTSYKGPRRGSAAWCNVPHGAVVIEFGSAILSEEQLRDMFGPKGLGVHFLALTNSDNTEKSSKWIVVIPFAEPANSETAWMVTTGIAHYLGLDTESALARMQKGFTSPNKIAHDEKFCFIDSLGSPKNWLCPEDRFSIFMQAASKGWSNFLAEQEAEGTYARVNPNTKNLSTEESGVLDWIDNHYSLAELLERNGYLQREKKLYLPPNSRSWIAGVRVFEDSDGRTSVISYHRRKDPLSKWPHLKHALSVAYVLCIFEYKKDFSRMLREEKLKKELVKLEASYQKLSAAYFELKSQHI